MIKVVWQDVVYEVRRIIVSDTIRNHFESALEPVIQRYQLELADECTKPMAGDFWIGCSPQDGWGKADPYRTAWASELEAREAMVTLNAVLPRHRRQPFSLVRFLFPDPVPSAIAFA